MFSAVIHSIKYECTAKSVRANILSGITVGIIALPLSMALAIASGVPPQHGLYTAMIAGAIIALSGGSKVNISGPTAAFVVVLLPIVQQYGLGGLLLSGFMAGVILILMGFLRLGRLIEVVPYPVVVGFTAGIGVVIAGLQIKDFFGLDVNTLDGHFMEKLLNLFLALPGINWSETLIGALTLAVLLVWPRLKIRLPGHLVALLVGSLVAWLLHQISNDFSVATIGSRFSYQTATGTGSGIPAILPGFTPPWQQPGPQGAPLGMSFELVRELLGPAVTIAVLGALESLLCAVVADGMSGKKHNPNDELIGQGIGNLLVPFFGGIPATAAMARTAANVRAGGTSPLSSVIHSVFILFAILSLAPLLAFIPMAAMAALLLVVAWNMSEARHFVRTVKVAPRADVITLLTCFLLTIIFDMTIAVAIGMGLAAMLFIRRSIDLAEVVPAGGDREEEQDSRLPEGVAVYAINGPLFFGSAQKALRGVAGMASSVNTVILDMGKVSILDMSAIIAMETIVQDFQKRKVNLVINNLEPRLILKLRKAGVHTMYGVHFSRSLDDAVAMLEQLDTVEAGG
ncbi:MAG: C4-dicarboxylic acid transporter DauA [Thioalkalispiraceae bacterium]|jgi:SulP family sulfate permease